MPGKCIFREYWITDVGNEDIAKWLRSVPGDKYKAFCTFCSATFDISHSGLNAVKVHSKGKKHGELSAAIRSGKQSVLPFKNVDIPASQSKCSVPEKSQDNSSKPGSSKVEDTVPSQSSDLSSFVVSEAVLKAEVFWAINKVMSHSSARSCAKDSDLFQLMFPDSVIAQKFHMQKDKLSYMITYGLGPFFQDSLVKELRTCEYFCLSVDESLNKVSQMGQMDILVRYWNTSVQEISTCYLTSVFLGRSTASDLLEAFHDGILKLGLSAKCILQIATDGPNVNIKFLTDFKRLMESSELNEEGKILIDPGTCSLHFVHGSYKTAHNLSAWKINEFLRALYYYFKDFPSRRSQYTSVTGSSLFPLKMCSIRWVENIKVIERALHIIPYLKKYIESVSANPPESNNFSILRSFVKDDLLPAKLSFLQSVAAELQSFLVSFQTDKPLMPFLYIEMYSILRNIGKRFLKGEVIKAVKSPAQMLSVDIKNKDNLLSVKDIDIGFGARSACKGLKDINIMSFRRDCREFLIAIFEKLISKRSPIRNKVIRGATCLAPAIMMNSGLSNSRVTLALEEFVSANWISPLEADQIKSCYLKLCESKEFQQKLTGFDWKTQRLDTFFVQNLHADDAVFRNFAMKILCMFHGNAAIERGFSVNKECLIENLHKDSLIAQRCIHSAVSQCGGVEKVVVSKSMIRAVKLSSSRRREALETKRKKEEEEQDKINNTRNEIRALEQEKRKLLEQAEEAAERIQQKIASAQKKLRQC